MLNSRGDKLWVAFCTALLCWGVVSCSMRAEDANNQPVADPWTKWATYCRQVGGTYVPPVETPNTARAGELVPEVMPTCLRPDRTPMTFTARNPEDMDVEPVQPAVREWPR